MSDELKQTKTLQTYGPLMLVQHLTSGDCWIVDTRNGRTSAALHLCQQCGDEAPLRDGLCLACDPPHAPDCRCEDCYRGPDTREEARGET